MARPPDTSLDAVVDAAAGLFARRGYRRTQMADVARALGVSPGTLYRYVESKEALFDLCVQRAFLAGDAPPPPALPVPTPPKDLLALHVRERLQAMADEAYQRGAKAAAAARTPAAEVGALVGVLFDFQARQARGLRMLERSVADRPELAAIYFGEGRGALIDRAARYIAARVADGSFAPVPDARVAARFVIEVSAWFAMHRHGDPAPAAMDDAVVRETVVRLCTRALVKEDVDAP